MAASAINLPYELSPIRQSQGDLGADRGTARNISLGILRKELRLVGWVPLHGQEWAKHQRLLNVGAFVEIDIRRAPLIRDNEVQSSVAIDVSDRDAPADLVLIEANRLCYVVIAAVVRANEEGHTSASAEIVFGLKSRPDFGI